MKHVLLVILILAALYFGARLHYPGRAPVKLPAASCDASLWNHVYLPKRLRLIEACTAIEGRVAAIQKESDGDLHIAIEPDQASVLNLVNAIHGHRRLVVESICDHDSAPGSYSHAACAGFTLSVTIPKIGDRVRATGSYVTDSENGWREIHPVSRIEILR
jgi:hypothetical protein